MHLSAAACEAACQCPESENSTIRLNNPDERDNAIELLLNYGIEAHAADAEFVREPTKEEAEQAPREAQFRK
jgi:hypothetical protein